MGLMEQGKGEGGGSGVFWVGGLGVFFELG